MHQTRSVHHITRYRVTSPWLQLVKCKAAIDAVADPKSQSKKAATPSVCGEVRQGSPRRNKVVANRLHRWMVKPEILEHNPHWVDDGRVLDNQAVDVPLTRTKRKASTVPAENIAGPSDKGKCARIALQARQKTLEEKLGEGTHDDTMADD